MYVCVCMCVCMYVYVYMQVKSMMNKSMSVTQCRAGQSVTLAIKKVFFLFCVFLYFFI